MSDVDVTVGEGDGVDAVVPAAGCAELAELGRVLGVLAGVVDASATSGSRVELADVVAGCQGLINTLTAVQDVAIMGVAAIEEEWAEDGLIVESRRAPGHVALDAPDVVAAALLVSQPQAQRRVSLAARLAAAGQGGHREDGDGDGAPGEVGDLGSAEPVVADSDGADAADAESAGSADDAGAAGDADAADAEGDAPVGSGFGGVHQAMRAGLLDGYAASVLGEELEAAPGEVAAAVVSAIGSF